MRSSAPTPVQPAPVSELEASSIFWERLTGGEWGRAYDNMADMAATADLIVVGRVAGLRFGEKVGDFEVTRATVIVEEVLKGTPETLTPGSITLQTVPAYDREATAANIPSHSSLMFLWYAPALLERLGQPIEEQLAEKFDYVLVNGSQGLVRNIDGVVRALDPRDPSIFPAALDGRDFRAAVVDARRLAAAVSADN